MDQSIKEAILQVIAYGAREEIDIKRIELSAERFSQLSAELGDRGIYRNKRVQLFTLYGSTTIEEGPERY